eukprot:5330628-Prymnesium_polylepis.1
MLAAFEGTGYRVRWRLLNARRWVAQKRLRLYIVGFRSDLPGAASFGWPTDEPLACDGGAPTVRGCLEPPDSPE